MRSLPPFHAILRRAPLLVGALVLTQVPASVLLAMGGLPVGAGWGIYAFGSLLAAWGIFAVALAWWTRIERIVSLVQGYAESGQLPTATAAERQGSVEAVQSSLASLDRVVRNLEDDATKDPLTGAFNRRCCATRLDADLARHRRSGTPFSLALFDLDDLKTINDRFGHVAGDTALRKLTQLIEECIREGDWVARWGGDEFLIGLWNADRDAAVAATERIFARFVDDPLEFGAERLALSASAGVAQALPEDDATGLFGRADEALMTSKRAGRGRISVA